MKQSKRGLWIVALICIMVGACLGGAGFALGGRLHSGWGVRFGNVFGIGAFDDGEVVTNKDENITVEAFDHIDLDVAIGDVVVERGSDYGLIIKNLPADYYQVTQESGKLKLEYTNDSFFDGISFFNFDFGSKDYKITVIVPEGKTMEEIKVSSSMGDITIDDVDTKALELNQAMGEVDVKNVNVDGDTVIEQEMGDITFTGTLHGKSIFDNSMGDIDIRVLESNEEYRYNLDTSMGSVKCQNANINEKSNTEATGGSSQAKYMIEADDSMGDIDLEFDY